MHRKNLFFICLVLMTFACQNLYSQDTVKITVPIKSARADSIFLSRNLLLLAEKYNVESSRAMIIQARLFNNITFNLDQNVYNPETKEWFDVSETGETAASVQKLFFLAGKRNKHIALADLTYKKEEQHYFDLIRTLKYTLRIDFNNIYYLKQILSVYDKEINSLEAMVTVFESQAEKGFVSVKEVLRLKSALFSLESEKNGYATELIANLSDFNLLLQTRDIDYEPQIDSLTEKRIRLESVKLQPLIDTAVVYRYDLVMASSDLSISQVNLKIQKAQAIPDLTLSAGWDKNGSFVHNYNFIGLQIDLPFFNRNQGNIKSAAMNVESSKVMLQISEDNVKSQVIQSYATALAADKLFHRYDEKFVNKLQLLNEEMKINYEKRNISIMEFLDFYDAYKNSIIQLNNLQNARANAIENLNFSVGKDIANK